jgi:hypothetical protein
MRKPFVQEIFGGGRGHTHHDKCCCDHLPVHSPALDYLKDRQHELNLLQVGAAANEYRKAAAFWMMLASQAGVAVPEHQLRWAAKVLKGEPRTAVQVLDGIIAKEDGHAAK